MTGSHTFKAFPFPAAWKALRCLFFSNSTQKLSCWGCCWCGHLHRTVGMVRNWLDGDFPCSFPLFPWLFIVEDSFAAGEGESFSCLLLKSTLATCFGASRNSPVSALVQQGNLAPSLSTLQPMSFCNSHYC